ncbi:MAG: hypothetical protein WB711_13415 [Terriglobales bacterium]
MKTTASKVARLILILAILSIPSAAQLPSGWSDADVGSVGTAGSASFANNTFTIAGSGPGGVDEYSTDAFHFAYQAIVRDCYGGVPANALPAGARLTFKLR